jgi:hypothetical protein
MGMIDEQHDHRVRISLKTRDIWDIDERVLEVAQIRAWLDELTDWQPEAYSMRYYHDHPDYGSVVDVWFKHEHHAVACALKWS